MKQKYKVFINDNSLEFLEKVPPEINPTICYSEDYDPLLLVQKLAGESPEYENHVTSTLKRAGSTTPKQDLFHISRHPKKSMELFTGNFKIIKAAGGLVKRTDNEDLVLMIYRLGKWDLPKGKTEKGESTIDCALREVEEECGIGNLKIIRKLPITWHMYYHKERWLVKETDWFEMQTDDRRSLTPQKEEGITEVKWVSKDEIPSLLKNSYSSIAALLNETILNN